MKNIIVKILILAILFIPSYFAIYEYVSSVSDPIEEDSVTEMTLTDPDGNSTKFSRDNAIGNKMINYFVSLSDRSRSIAELPKDLEGCTHYVVTYQSFGRKTVYNYYFSKTKPSNSYFTDNSQKAYRIPAASVIEFLDSDFSTYMYPSSKSPSMTMSGTKIIPSSFKWHYYSYSNVSHSVPTQTQKDPIRQRISYRAFELAFDRYADSVDILVKTENGSVFYEGAYLAFKENGAFSALTEDAVFNVTITATWEDSPALGYGGSAVYDLILDIFYNPPGTFWLGEDAIESGEFVVLSGINVEDPDKISCTISPSIDYTPVFYNDGDCVRAILPFPVTLGNEQRDYTVTVEYLGIETRLNLTVKKNSYEFKTRKYNYNTPVNVAARTTSNINAFKNFVTQAPYGDQIFVQGAFTLPTKDIRAKYGDTINNTSSSKDKFTSGGSAFVAYSNTEILCANYGTVVAVGNTEYGGKTVVVDHGFGLRSVYYCIGTVSVMEGEYVKPGTVIGKGSAKNQGYTDGITAYFELWVHDTPVSAEFLADGGRTAMIVYGNPPEID